MSESNVMALMKRFNDIVEVYKEKSSPYKFGALLGIYESYTTLIGYDNNSKYMDEVLKDL